jgi:hypothetical protein
MTTVQLILYGLVALVPITTNGLSNHMVALLIDAQNASAPAEFGGCVAPHTAEIRFPIAAGEPGCAMPLCKPVGLPEGPYCSCKFFVSGRTASKSVRFDPDINPTPQQLSTPDPASKPAIPAVAPDFYYIANFNRFGYSLNERYRGPNPPSPVVQVQIPFGEVIPCALATRPVDENNNMVHSFGFRELAEYDDGDPGQALAQLLLIKNNYQLPAGTGLVVHISDSDGSNDVAIPMAQRPDVTIWVTNHRDPVDVDSPCNDGIGRDFALFYTLTEENPEWDSRSLPHLKPTQYGQEVENPACATLPPEKMPTSRPICPMATFN